MKSWYLDPCLLCLRESKGLDRDGKKRLVMIPLEWRCVLWNDRFLLARSLRLLGRSIGVGNFVGADVRVSNMMLESGVEFNTEWR